MSELINKINAMHIVRVVYKGFEYDTFAFDGIEGIGLIADGLYYRIIHIPSHRILMKIDKLYIKDMNEFVEMMYIYLSDLKWTNHYNYVTNDTHIHHLNQLSQAIQDSF